MANHDVVWFLCTVQNYLKSPALVIYQHLQLINRDGQDGDPGNDRIYGQQQV
jgi:hypothetical protein